MATNLPFNQLSFFFNSLHSKTSIYLVATRSTNANKTRATHSRSFKSIRSPTWSHVDAIIGFASTSSELFHQTDTVFVWAIYLRIVLFIHGELTSSTEGAQIYLHATLRAKQNACAVFHWVSVTVDPIREKGEPHFTSLFIANVYLFLA